MEHLYPWRWQSQTGFLTPRFQWLRLQTPTHISWVFWKCLLLWWWLIIHRDQLFSSMLLDKCKVYVDKRLFQLPFQGHPGKQGHQFWCCKEHRHQQLWGRGRWDLGEMELHNFWRPSITTLIWERFLLFGVISPFMLSSITNVGVGWKSLWWTGSKEETEIHWAETCQQMRTGKALR